MCYQRSKHLLKQRIWKHDHTVLCQGSQNLNNMKQVLKTFQEEQIKYSVEDNYFQFNQKNVRLSFLSEGN